MVKKSKMAQNEQIKQLWDYIRRILLSLVGSTVPYTRVRHSQFLPLHAEQPFSVQHFVHTLPHGNPLTSPWPTLITNYKIGRYHITLLRIVSHLHKACSCPLLQIFSANLIHPGHLFVPNPRLFERDNWWIVRLTQWNGLQFNQKTFKIWFFGVTQKDPKWRKNWRTRAKMEDMEDKWA